MIIHSSFCAFNSKVPTCRPSFAKFSCTI